MGQPMHLAKSIEGVTSGSSHFYEFPAGRVGEIRSIVAKQTSGTLAGFEVQFYLSVDGAAGDLDFDSDLYAFTDIVTAANTVALAAAYDKNYAFATVGDADGGLLSKSDKLVVRIKPAGSGAKDFEVAIVLSVPSAIS